MTHGGVRLGAGRKRGALSQKTREVAEAAAQAGKTPLEVMVEAYRHFYNKGDFEKAAAIAKDAAPYMHPRLSQIESKTQTIVRMLSHQSPLSPSGPPRRPIRSGRRVLAVVENKGPWTPAFPAA